MSMQPIIFKVALFRGDFDQARSQYSLLWLMEALVRINQSHLRQYKKLAQEKRVPAPYPPLYRAGIHYEPEPGTEEWLDIPNMISVHGGTFPGPWADCLPVSTKVMKDDYTFTTLGQLAPGDRIMGDGKITTVLEQVVTGEKPILAFELNNGAVLRCSPEHRLFLSDDTEVRAEDVKVGQLLKTPTKAFETGPELKSELAPDDFAWLLGTYVADGWTDFPRHPSFSIAGKDGFKKEEQKRRVKALVEKLAGTPPRWHERYITVHNRALTEYMAQCGGHAPQKHLPSLMMTQSQVRAVLEGLKADASFATSGTVTHGTTSELLALQTRVLYRMLGQSVHIKRWDDHGGLGKNPIYRITVRKSDEEVGDWQRNRRHAARVVAIREEEEELCADITTDTGRFWLPESDLIVHNCEDLACWRTAELRESGIKAKPFAKWRLKPDGSYAYHALTLLPDGRLEDPSLVLGMGNEPEFARLRMAERYKDGSLTPSIRFAKTPDVVVVDKSQPSGVSKDIKGAQKRTGLLSKAPPAGSPVDGMITGRTQSEFPEVKGRASSDEDGSIYSNIQGDARPAWGYDRAEVREADMRRLMAHQNRMRRLRDVVQLPMIMGEQFLGRRKNRTI